MSDNSRRDFVKKTMKAAHVVPTLADAPDYAKADCIRSGKGKGKGKP